jgi:FkbM family methyltransferase
MESRMSSGNGAGVSGALDAKSRLTRAGLAIRALRRRVDALGMRAVFASAIPAGTRLVYVDIGMHKRALQLRFVKDVFGKVLNLRTIGFEAHPEYFRAAATAIGPGANDSLHNLAVVGPGQGSTVRLNLNGGEGLGDSIVRATSDEAIDIGAVRLSDVLRTAGVDRSADVVILRMNIEGAELFVLEDLVQSGLIPRIDGYYGYWDDPQKIGGDIARRFNEIMSRTRIDNFPFNDREFRSRVRLAAVKYDLTTTILAALRKRTA